MRGDRGRRSEIDFLELGLLGLLEVLGEPIGEKGPPGFSRDCRELGLQVYMGEPLGNWG